MATGFLTIIIVLNGMFKLISPVDQSDSDCRHPHILTVKKLYKGDATMDELKKAEEKLSRLTDRDVRIVYLPPSDVAAYRYEGEEPEARCWQVMSKFILDSDLPRIKPDLRHYGFNAPNPVDETNAHG